MKRRLLILLIFLTSCSVGPAYEAPHVELKADLPENKLLAEPKSESEIALPDWGDIFPSDTVSKVLSELESRNLDLEILRSRVQEARHLANVSRIELLPVIDSSASYTKARFNAFAAGFGNGQINTEIYSAGFDATWEIDILGGRRREIQANSAVKEQAEFQLEDAMLTLKGDFLSTLNDYILFEKQVDVLERTVERQQKLFSMVEQQAKKGTGTLIDSNRSASLLYEARALLAPARISSASSYHRMNTLLGYEAGSDVVELPENIDVETIKIVGTAKDLLENRPDVRSAERALAAETYRIGVEKADLYPRFYFNGSVSLQATKDNFGQKEEAWSFGPSIRWSFLDAFRQMQEVYAQEEKSQQAFLQFRNVVLLSIEDVSNSLIAYENRKLALEDLEKAVASSKKAADLTKMRYDVGFSDFFEVLEAEREYLAISLSAIEARRQFVRSAISVKKSIGKARSSSAEKTADEQ